MLPEGVIKLAAGSVSLNPSPIYSNWILEGSPIARHKVLSSSADGTASTLIWDCTAGRFNWFYDVDETIFVLEGGVVLRDVAGTARRLSAGDSVFFPAGARAEWTVETYIRKLAFCRAPLPGPVVFAKRGVRFLKRMISSRNGSANASPVMFQGN
jgi:uncharacterized cupin superfamily protein